MFDTSHPMLKPLWVRLVTCAAPLGWACFEWLLGNPTWAFLFGITGLLCVHQLFLTYVPPEDEADAKGENMP
ncbi:DUF3329 domain-containing protein [uncultured Cohaesibacter sp.]|uniref:DUF3329 domain-containing protein n=1 Tax=uncultured Cohaesibacter sp. TaxID=1002546 RepID=UPI0029303585|nr:DUF3329 domain-containing protein [uncultured Cohaesibacter sp.]